MAEWQPIESAPRDGSWFLIARADESYDGFEIGCYAPYAFPEYVEAENGLYRKEMRPIYEWRGFNNFHRATHWQPLPEPPSTIPQIAEGG